tara:strand:- start:1920 stop:2216 length:297 start_codon:yes stop_codon:yes gene_type:complete
MLGATATPTTATYDALIKLDRMLKDVKANQHDRVIALIEICIERGIDTGKCITAVLSKLGFKKRHVGLLLNELAGPTSVSARWYHEGGRYKLHQRDVD